MSEKTHRESMKTAFDATGVYYQELPASQSYDLTRYGERYAALEAEWVLELAGGDAMLFDTAGAYIGTLTLVPDTFWPAGENGPATIGLRSVPERSEVEAYKRLWASPDTPGLAIDRPGARPGVHADGRIVFAVSGEELDETLRKTRLREQSHAQAQAFGRSHFVGVIVENCATRPATEDDREGAGEDRG